MEKLIEDLSALNTTQITELRTRLEALWGVKGEVFIAGPVMQEEAAVKIEQIEFIVNLIGFAADKKMAAIKEVRAITNLGLADSKIFVETAAPGAAAKEVKAGLTKEQAEELKAKLEAVGCMAEIK